jgi:stalled ribosome rescue protein Dom34
MEKNVGVWIDHRKAVIASISGKGEEIREIPSNMEKHIRFSGGEQDGPADDQRDMRFTGHLQKYYNKIVSCLHDADSILILGPGEAKGEFEKRLRAESLGARIIGVEAADKMTYDQIVTKVRDHFPALAKETQQNKKR